MPQAESYVHRFGPGMILYWFGHAPTELLAGDKDICIADELPKSFMLPDGTMVGKGYHDESKPTKVANIEAKKVSTGEDSESLLSSELLELCWLSPSRGAKKY